MSREMVALARLPFITRLMCEGERRINLENSLMLIGSGDVFTFIFFGGSPIFEARKSPRP